jgi:hypothetical protein
MTLIVHLVRAAFRAFFRLVVTVIVAAAVGVGGTLGVAYQQFHVWPPKTLTEVTAGVIGVLAAYAAGITVLVREAIAGVKDVERGAAHEVAEELHEVESHK